jgi:hypothetical protein
VTGFSSEWSDHDRIREADDVVDMFEGGRLFNLRHDAGAIADARNAYNPFVRGGTLLAHIAAMLGQKAGRTGIFRRIATPVLEAKRLQSSQAMTPSWAPSAES